MLLLLVFVALVRPPDSIHGLWVLIYKTKWLLVDEAILFCLCPTGC